MAGLVIENLVKSYGSINVVHGISLDIADKEFIVLVGPSGCGKSTTLRMIAGLEEISGGTIAIGDRIVNDLPPRERNISMVFQSYALYPHMSVRDNMGFSLKLAKLARSEIDSRVNEAASILGLEALMDRRPAHLSGGQRQRVAMGRAIVRNPDVFLFDEPLSNLDAKLRTQMRTEIKKLHAKVQSTIVYVTHDQIEAMTLADRIVIMRDGHIEQIGTPDEVFQRPKTQFVASFIGSPPMNMASATHESGRLVFGDGTTIPMPDHFRGKLAEGEAVTFGLRPDNFFPTGHGLSSTEASQLHEERLEVMMIEPLGQETLVFVEFAGQEWVARMLNPRPLKRGEKIPVQLDLQQAHLFNSQNGQRLL